MSVTFKSATELAAALRAAEVAHAEYEKKLGHRDAEWADWYAGYMAGKANQPAKADNAFWRAFAANGSEV